MAFFLVNGGAFCRDGDCEVCSERLLQGVAYWLASVPSMMAVSYRVAWALQRQRSLRVLDMLASLAVLLSAALICSSYVALDIFLEIIPPPEGPMRCDFCARICGCYCRGVAMPTSARAS